ncbi:MAG: hypothetical protein COC01_09015 [Bacteroidetes bacterium]|nr:MAG: hypothetical protein COC01_09015 [Bacteroidota bacterium]
MKRGNIYCTECGKENEATFKYCIYCGHKLLIPKQEVKKKPSQKKPKATKSDKPKRENKVEKLDVPQKKEPIQPLAKGNHTGNVLGLSNTAKWVLYIVIGLVIITWGIKLYDSETKRMKELKDKYGKDRPDLMNVKKKKGENKPKSSDYTGKDNNAKASETDSYSNGKAASEVVEIQKNNGITKIKEIEQLPELCIISFECLYCTFKIISKPNNHIQVSPTVPENDLPKIQRFKTKRALIYIILKAFIHMDIKAVTVTSVPEINKYTDIPGGKGSKYSSPSGKYLKNYKLTLTITRKKVLSILNKYLGIESMDALMGEHFEGIYYPNNENPIMNRILYNDQGNPTLDVIYNEMRR